MKGHNIGSVKTNVQILVSHLGILASLIVAVSIMPLSCIAQVSSWSTPTLAVEPPSETYAYAPSAILDGTTEHIFVCQNQTPGVITDSIYYYKRVSGTIVESQMVLEPGASGAWDSNNTCDPNVIQGSFLMSGVTYQYALFYTGNNNSSSTNNQVGVAFSNSLDSGWVKYPYPLIFNTDGTSAWGAGQPSVTSVDGVGNVLIFYTDGSTTLTQGMVANLNISNMASITTNFYQPVPTAGLTFSSGSAGDYLNNFDVVYDSTDDLFYVVREQHPYPTNFPTWLPYNQQVASIPGSAIWSGSGTWSVDGNITPAVTGFPRNHNAGFVRTYYGSLPSSSSLQIQFDQSCEDTGGGTCTWPSVLWGYYVYEITGTL